MLSLAFALTSCNKWLDVMPDNRAEIDTEEKVEWSLLVRELLRGFGKLWWLVAVLVAVVATGALLYSMRTYRPLYKAKATFTVETYTNQGGYTFYYDNSTAAQMARTFPYILESNLLLEELPHFSLRLWCP